MRVKYAEQSGGVSGFPVWSPEGTRVAFGFDTWHLVDATETKIQAPPAEPASGPTERFMPSSWSPNGERIVGTVMSPGGSIAGLSTVTLATKRYVRVPGDTSAHYWLWPVWLADSRRLLVRGTDGIALVDAATGARHLVLPVAGSMLGRSVGVSRDNRWITYTETATEGDVWVATLRTPDQRE